MTPHECYYCGNKIYKDITEETICTICGEPQKKPGKVWIPTDDDNDDVWEEITQEYPCPWPIMTDNDGELT